MPLLYESARKQYKIGAEPVVVHQKVYRYELANISKDIIRELARSASIPNYSNKTLAEMITALNALEELPINHVELRVIRKAREANE
jgi:hypothetical protein